jgi:hypothetical protein
MGMTAKLASIPQAQLDFVLAQSTEVRVKAATTLLLDASRFRCAADQEVKAVDINKAWAIIHFLLTGSQSLDGHPLDRVLMSKAVLCLLGDDWGLPIPLFNYARYATFPEVLEIAAALELISADTLISRYDHDTVVRSNVYPGHWGTTEADIRCSKEWVLPWYEQVRRLYRSAAFAGDAVLQYIDG